MIHSREDYNRIQDPEGKIPADEPVFLLRGQDQLACLAVAYYAGLCAQAQSPEVAAKAQEHSLRMQAWPNKKVPDLPSGAKPAKASMTAEELQANGYYLAAYMRHQLEKDMKPMYEAFGNPKPAKDDTARLREVLVATLAHLVASNAVLERSRKKGAASINMLVSDNDKQIEEARAFLRTLPQS